MSKCLILQRHGAGLESGTTDNALELSKGVDQIMAKNSY